MDIKIWRRSASTRTMDIKNWRRSTSTRTIRLGRHYEEAPEPAVKLPASNNMMIKWKVLWRKFLKEKKKVFESPARVHVQSPYDTETYLQNFDQGQTLDEPDVVLRSFSMRFADPSKLLPQKDLIM